MPGSTDVYYRASGWCRGREVRGPDCGGNIGLQDVSSHRSIGSLAVGWFVDSKKHVPRPLSRNDDRRRIYTRRWDCRGHFGLFVIIGSCSYILFPTPFWARGPEYLVVNSWSFYRSCLNPFLIFAPASTHAARKVSEWVEFNAPLDTIQVISEVNTPWESCTSPIQ